jgi:hypothetical protein
MNAWHNITYVYDHTTTNSKVYIDNAEVLSYNYSLSQGVSGSYPGVQFADYWNSTGVAGLGLIYFYTRAITVGEVADIYNQNSARFISPAPSLIAQYDLSDITSYSGTGNTLYDISGNANNLTLYNSPTFSGTGQSKTLLFEGYTGNQYADSAAIASVPGTITINAWFKASDPASWYATVFAVSVGLTGVLVWSDYGNNFVYNFQVNNTVVPSAIPFNPSGFDNIIASISNGNSVYYVNGVQVATSSTAVSNFNNVNIQLNGYPGGGTARMGTYAFGLFELYNSAFGSTAVANLFATQSPRFGSPPPPPPPPPTSEYSPFDNASYSGSGNTWFDLTANNNDLALTNATFATTPIKSFTFTNGNAYKSSPVNFPTNNFTFDIWLKFNGGTEQVIYAAGHDGSGSCALLGYRFPSVNSYKPFWEMGGGVARLNMTLDPTVDTWYNYVFTGDGTTVKGYVNGVLDVSVSQSYGSIASSNYGSILGNFITGLGAPSSSFPSITTYGQYAIYNNALTATDILNNYNTNLPNYSAPYVGSVGGRIFGEGLNG